MLKPPKPKANTLLVCFTAINVQQIAYLAPEVFAEFLDYRRIEAVYLIP